MVAAGGKPGGASPRPSAPATVTGATGKAFDTYFTDTANALLGGMDLPEGSGGGIDPAALQALRLRAAELYQQNKNVTLSAVQAWQDVMGDSPTVTQGRRTESNWFSPDVYDHVIGPSAPAKATGAGKPSNVIVTPNGTKIELLP